MQLHQYISTVSKRTPAGIRNEIRRNLRCAPIGNGNRAKRAAWNKFGIIVINF